MKTDILIHGHHDCLISFQNLAERIEEIKEYKPFNEIPTRLRLIKKLSRKAIAEIPDDVISKWKKYNKLIKDLNYDTSGYWALFMITLRMWSYSQEGKRFHDKWCGCKKWNKRGIVFVK